MKDEMEKEKIRENSLKLAFITALSGEDGLIILEHLADFCKESDAPFIADAAQAAYWQGRRSVMVEIRKLLRKE